MQKSYNTIHKRSHPVRIASIGLAAITMFSLTELGHRSLQYVHENVQQHGAAVLAHTLMEKENETTRMPVRFTDGIRTQTISGSGV